MYKLQKKEMKKRKRQKSKWRQKDKKYIENGDNKRMNERKRENKN